MRQINFSLIFIFGLGTVFFTLENTNPTTVNVLPWMHYTLPLAALLLLSAPVAQCRSSARIQAHSDRKSVV